MKILFYISCIFLGLSVHGQSGYLGTFNSVGIKISGAPSLYQTSKYKSSTNQIVTTNRNFSFQYDIFLSKMVGKRAELSAGYKRRTIGLNIKNYSRPDTLVLTYGNSTDTYTSIGEKMIPQIEDAPLTINTFYFKAKFHRRGSIAPIGKYIGFGVDVGFGNISENETFFFGYRDSLNKKNFRKYSQDIIESEELSIGPFQYNSFQFNMYVGRSYPISRNLILSFGATLPIYTFTRINERWYLPIPIFDYFEEAYYEDVFDFRYYDQHHKFTHYDFGQVATRYVRKASWLSLDIGLSFHF